MHWRINNSELLSRLFTYEELLAHARPQPKLGPHALAAGPVHALLLACMHRATHKQNPYYVDGMAYYSGDRLIWLYDIHLLLGVLTPAEIDYFIRLASIKGLRAVCLEGIERAQNSFHSSVPPDLFAALGAAGTERNPLHDTSAAGRGYRNGWIFRHLAAHATAFAMRVNCSFHPQVICVKSTPTLAQAD